MNIHDTTLVAVSSTRINETLYAMSYSMGKARFSDAILLTSAKVSPPSGIRIQSIQPLTSIDAYSEFIIYELHKYIETRHCLIVQWDGFIINEKMWSDEFLSYDYIGAPFKKRHDDPIYATDDLGTFYAVGNGGFSLRSRALLEAPTRLQLGRPSWSASKNEDGFFCVENRRALEAHGFKWAPVDLAARFSNECGILDLQYLRQSFGFHGRRLLQRHQVIGRRVNCGY